MARRTFLTGALLILVTGSITTAGAGGAAASWAVSPTEGPSPNVIDVSGTDCIVNPGAGGLTLLGAFVPGVAHVELLSQDGGTELANADYTPDESGNWSGQFPIPPDLAAGPYPMKAYCNSPVLNGDGLSLAGPVDPPQFFQYEPDRSYTVVAEEKGSVKAEAVEAEATFTG
jgi:hypothetical protein